MQSHGFMAKRKKGSRQKGCSSSGGVEGRVERGKKKEDRTEHVLALRLNKT